MILLRTGHCCGACLLHLQRHNHLLDPLQRHDHLVEGEEGPEFHEEDGCECGGPVAEETLVVQIPFK